jgi:hypothetical protein
MTQKLKLFLTILVSMILFLFLLGVIFFNTASGCQTKIIESEWFYERSVKIRRIKNGYLIKKKNKYEVVPDKGCGYE